MSGSDVTSSAFPSLVTSIVVPVSAISAFAPLIPRRARMNSARNCWRAARTCPPMSSGSRVVPVAFVSSPAVIWRSMWIAGAMMCEGRSSASCTSHSPRSVSATWMPRPSR